jgi:hypothetical protein
VLNVFATLNCEHMSTPKNQDQIPWTPYQFRLPRPSRNGKPGEVDPWWQCNRSFWNERILPTERNQFKPDVKSVAVKQKGRNRGVRFIIWESAKSYFDKLRAEQEAK